MQHLLYPEFFPITVEAQYYFKVLPSIKFVASAKYLSRLITTFYRKSTINITDLININDDLHYNNNLSVPRDMSKDTLNH